MTVEALLTALGADLDALRRQQPPSRRRRGHHHMLTVEGLAQKAGMSQNTVLRVLNSKVSDVRVSTLVRIAAALGVELRIEVRTP